MTAGFLIVLPPSETKRDGGNTPFEDRLTGAHGDAPSRNVWPQFEPIRASVAEALVACAGDVSQTAAALKISEKLAVREAERNRGLWTAPRMPASRRYTGVLYDALDASSLEPTVWQWLCDHVAVHSALYGLVGAGESIAAYRCSSSSRLPGPTMTRRWAEPIAEVLRLYEGTMLDLRSSAYVKLGPAPHALTIDIVTEADDGTVRALNHFNKQAKGQLARALAHAGSRGQVPDDVTADALIEIMRGLGFDARPGVGASDITLLTEFPTRATTSSSGAVEEFASDGLSTARTT